MSDNEDSDGDEDMMMGEQFHISIMDKTITPTVTSEAQDVRDWIHQMERTNAANRLRLIVGIDIKLGSLPHFPVALLVLFVRRSCLIFELTYAEQTPPSLARFLSDRTNNTLVGIGIRPKLAQLQREFGGLGGGARWVDLGSITAERYNRAEMREAGVSELRRFLHGGDVERPAAVVGGWDAVVTDEQVRHACIDAYVSYELGSFLVFPIRREQLRIIRKSCPDGL